MVFLREAKRAFRVKRHTDSTHQNPEQHQVWGYRHTYRNDKNIAVLKKEVQRRVRNEIFEIGLLCDIWEENLAGGPCYVPPHQVQLDLLAFSLLSSS